MRRLLQIAARLYPPAWRDRYGREFDALLDDVNPGWTEVLDILRGAMQMQFRMWTFGKVAIGFALIGLLVAGVIAWQRPSMYRSTAVLKDPNASLDRLGRAEQEVFSRRSLSQLIVAGDLYPDERRSQPLEDIVEEMRNRAIQVRALRQPAAGAPFSVAFEYRDPVKAQFVTKQVIGRLTAEMAKTGGSPVEVLDPASLPDRPVGPRRSRILVMGSLAGLIAGIAIFGIGRWPKVALVGLAGAIVALIVAFAIPDRYLSNAVIRLPNEQMAHDLTSRTMSDSAFLQSIAQDRKLYDDPAAAIDRLKRDLQIRILNAPGAAVLISFSYAGPRSNHDLSRRNTQGVVRDIVARWVELAHAGPVKTEVEVLDPASYPENAVSPNRAVLAGTGLLAGVLLGIAWKFARRSPSLEHA